MQYRVQFLRVQFLVLLSLGGAGSGCAPSDVIAATPRERPAPPPANDEPRATAHAAANRRDAPPHGYQRVEIDLSDRWVPRVLRDGYAESYRALADERFDQANEADRARRERFLELYGIVPSLRVLRGRLTDDARYACHEGVDNAPLERGVVPRPWDDMLAQRERVKQYKAIIRALDRERNRLGVATFGEIPNEGRGRWMLARYRALYGRVEPVRTVQGHLRCEGLLSPRASDGVFDAWTLEALKAFQRKHMIISWGLIDEDTKRALLSDARELDYRALLRALRERVVDATGVIEDGSASGMRGTVFGRVLDPEEMNAASALPGLSNGAPDLVSAYVEQVARALRFTSPTEASERLAAISPRELETWHESVIVPNPPAYHAEHMELRAEIDRGDVWYDYPLTWDARPRRQPVSRRPSVVIYARDPESGRDVALIRWNTTIGGWKPEKLDSGAVGLRYKESDVGARVWRQVVAAPAWLPPDSAPDEELVRRSGSGYELARDLFGPGYASAYGLAMMVNEIAVPPRGDRTTTLYLDRGIRMHGSVSYASILRGTSHGCHRLFNHNAVRLAGFLLAHRHHGPATPNGVRYARRVAYRGHVFDLRLADRGTVYELDPPMPVRVLEGNVRGRLQRAPTGTFPLPEHLLARARAAMPAE